MRFIILMTLGLFVFACNKPATDNTVIDLGYNYFPTQVGSSWIYQVDSLVYDDNAGFTTIDTFSYLYKEQITEGYVDVTGNTAFYINRFFKLTDTTDWVESNRWSVMRTSLNVQKVQENIRFAKLVFPLALNKKWNGNMFNSFRELDYSIKTLDEAATIGEVPYFQTMKVQEKEEVNAIEEIISYETYARNVGLVYSLSDSLNSQISGTKGYRYRLTLKTFIP